VSHIKPIVIVSLNPGPASATVLITAVQPFVEKREELTAKWAGKKPQKAKEDLVAALEMADADAAAEPDLRSFVKYAKEV
jgi:hypothetical protein